MVSADDAASRSRMSVVTSADPVSLGSFFFSRNPKWTPETHSPAKPRFWVGRVVEIQRNGRVRLHWHKETELFSGVYQPTNNYFTQKASELRPFTNSAVDKVSKGWALFPVVERMTPDSPRREVAPEPVKPALLGGMGPPVPSVGQEPVSIGSFVFLRNARYAPAKESVALPRYWVGRVTAVSAPTPAARPFDDRKVKLQWLKETALGSGLFIVMPNVFTEKLSLVRVVPGGMVFDKRLQVWARCGDYDGATPPPLVFPGDEHLVVFRKPAQTVVVTRLKAVLVGASGLNLPSVTTGGEEPVVSPLPYVVLSPSSADGNQWLSFVSEKAPNRDAVQWARKLYEWGAVGEVPAAPLSLGVDVWACTGSPSASIAIRQSMMHRFLGHASIPMFDVPVVKVNGAAPLDKEAPCVARHPSVVAEGVDKAVCDRCPVVTLVLQGRLGREETVTGSLQLRVWLEVGFVNEGEHKIVFDTLPPLPLPAVAAQASPPGLLPPPATVAAKGE